MIDYSQFHAVFPGQGPTPYSSKDVQEIETLRKSLNGVLFIDRVLKALSIGQGRTYPPKGDNGLRSLHKHICDSKVSTHHKLSVFYYLLLDYDFVRGGKSQLAEEFAVNSGVPAKYQLLMRGLWHMDRKEFKFALEYLAHPSLPSEFADEIVAVLVLHAKDNDYSLPLAYYHTTQPVFKTSEAPDLLFGALVRTSITEALFFSRKYAESTRRLLFEKLVSTVLEDHALGGARIKELVGLPLDSFEEAWFQEYLTEGEGSKLKGAATAVETRQIITGRHKGQIRIRGMEDTAHGAKSARSAKAARWSVSTLLLS
ncbi:nuclear pore complex assembly-domain-containing protein [Coniochaeta sp. 2T2.1]|nr:nuclear pore complex assembly-domain-containing protein [Coniochaeta sp. 2T2.1]